MIINLKKYIFYGSKHAVADFFTLSQELGFIEFITNGEKKKKQPEPIQKLVSAIKILRKQPLKELYKGGGSLSFADEIASQVLDLTHEIEKFSEEKRFIEAEISRVSPFGQFSFDDVEYIQEKSGKSFQFYCVKTSKTHEIKNAESLIYIGTDYDLDYFIGLHDEPKSFSGMIEMHFERNVGELKNHLAFVNETIYQTEAELKGYAGYIEFFRESLLGQIDIHSLQNIQNEVDFPIQESLFSIEGWVPENKVEELDKLTKELPIVCDVIAVEKDEKVPTCMKNKKMSAIGEDLVRIYDIPSATDTDPSTWVLCAFIVFFAIILADGGYGLLYLGLAFFLRKKFPRLKGGAKRFLRLLFILSTSCVVWGLITTSFFGTQVSPTSPIARLSVLTHISEKKAEYHAEKNDETHKEWVKKYPSISGVQKGKEMLSRAYTQKGKVKEYEMLSEYNNNILLELSLFIGVVHISLSLLRYLKRSWANIGWVFFSVGSYLYFPVTLKATSLFEFLGLIPKSIAETVGIQLIYGGIGLAIVLALIQKKLKGIGEVAQILSVFADILSYLRLYALALASTIMAQTFNSMGLEIGLVKGSVVILAGHSVNLLLGTMGGVIHGLRLNFIEWYHYSFEGEGRLFNPFRRLRIKQE